MIQSEKVKLGVTIILVGVFLYMAAGALKRIRLESARPTPSAGNVSVKPLADAAARSAPALALYKRLEQQTAGMALGSDPFTHMPLGAYTVKTVKLTGILWDAHAPRAIVAGKFLKTGDRVGAITIVSIQQDKVIVSDGNREMELRLE
ncbi:MAG: hypothetical protein ABH865_05355 [Candidatus Omnitrophota bacterium]|nr:hypothetical protein [Candidatus Omnitrophota bacterium]